MIPALASLAVCAFANQAKVVAPVPIGPIAPVLSAVGAALRPSLALPAPIVGPAGGVLLALPAGAPLADLEAAVGRGSEAFDGGRAAPGPLAVANDAGSSGRKKGSSGQRWPGWSRGAFESPIDGAPIAFRWRTVPGADARPVRVFVGGMALADSFESYLRTNRPRSAQYVLVPRGLPPTEWALAQPQLDADARDLARMIVVAARERGASAIELVLHSYAAFSFQRMLQLAADPEVAAAVELLRAGRVVWMGGTTHWKGSESTLGPEFELAAQNARMLVGFVDSMDAYGRAFRKAAELNPLLAPQAAAWDVAWSAQRAATLQLAANPTRRLLREHLEAGWAKELEPIKRRLLAELDEDSRRPGWGEAALRRMTGGLELEFGDADLARLRQLGLRVDMIYAQGDQFIPWSAERQVLLRLGIDAPKELPRAGTVLRDETGLVSVRIVEGDHYLPLKRPGEFARALEEP